MILTKKQQKSQHYDLEKNDNYEYLTGEKILPSNQRQIVEQATFTYSPLVKAFEKQRKEIKEQPKKQIKTVNDQGEKQIKALLNRATKRIWDTDQKSITSLFSKDYLNKEATYKLDRNDLIYKIDNKKNA